jgi:glycosyltransferase involved in cell wall biosynthesis
VVKGQLVAEGVPEERIWQAPYGVDTEIFSLGALRGREGAFRVIFAGQFGLRKGVRTLLEALELAGRPEWVLECYGLRLDEIHHDLTGYRGTVVPRFHGAVSQRRLAEAFRGGSVLVLPSLEEGFGLVVPQALSCGLPVVVSDRVGARDLVRHRENGSVFPVGEASALAAELVWWAENWRPATEEFSWQEPASTLIACSRRSLV